MRVDTSKVIFSYVAVLAVFITTFLLNVTVFKTSPISREKSNRNFTFAVRRDTAVTLPAAPAPDLTLTNGYSVEMMVRITVRGGWPGQSMSLIGYLYCYMLRSAALFWSPKLGGITMVLDEESWYDHEFANRLKKQKHLLGFNINILYEHIRNDQKCLLAGYTRQLWNSFFMDLYTNASVIAWMDSDAMFSTPVIPENIFEGNRLRVKGEQIRPYHDHVVWAGVVEIALGRKMFANFMSYFPVFIWRDTITNCRNYITKRMKARRFEDAFMRFNKKHPHQVSPVCILLTYAYYFEHDRYDWHIDVNNNLTAYNQKFTDRGYEIRPTDISPDLHVTVHKKHYDDNIRENPMKQGYCVAKRYLDKLPVGCEKFKDTVNFQLFEFEAFAQKKVYTNHWDTWCKKGKNHEECVKLIERYYKNVKKHHERGLYDLDLHKVLNVERAAKMENEFCPEIFNFTKYM